MKILSLLLSLLFFAGCTTSGTQSEREITHRKMRTLSSQLKKKELQLERLKARNEILKGTKKKKRSNLSRMARMDLSKMTEKEAYSGLLKRYKKSDEKGLRFAAKKFIERYPKSRYNDNIYYMMGSLKLKNKDYVKSIKFFDKVERSYANQDKAPHAIYAKGLVYKKLGLNDQAKASFKKVLSKYSNSPIAKRAREELKTTIK